jgi:glutamate/tyrosine decarboxylase-like PLP-dependent enzyme
VRDKARLPQTFRLDGGFFKGYSQVASGELPIPYREQGPQNSRGFRALKVWLCLQRAGRRGYARMIGDDIRLARHLYERVAAEPALEAFSQNLSTTTFRYVPRDLAAGTDAADAYSNELNTELLRRLQASGEMYLSHASVRGAFLLRACIVNFRTTLADVERIPKRVVELGAQIDAEMRERTVR